MQNRKKYIKKIAVLFFNSNQTTLKRLNSQDCDNVTVSKEDEENLGTFFSVNELMQQQIIQCI